MIFKLVVIVVDIRKIGGDEGSGSVLSGGSFDNPSGGNPECEGHGEDDSMVISKVTKDGKVQGHDG